MNIIMAMDPHNYEAMKTGTTPRVPYSHDRNLLLYAHIAIKTGHKVYMASGVEGLWIRDIREIKQVYPVWEFQTVAFDVHKADCIFGAGAEQLRLKHEFPNTKLVGVMSALHMFESPALHGPEYPFRMITAVRDHLDFLITLNQRMAETLVTMLRWLGKIDYSDRLLVAPLGFCEQEIKAPSTERDRRKSRSAFNLTNDDILFVNAGGTWGWTDTDTFLQAFCKFSENHDHHLRVYFSGIKQPNNRDHNSVAENIYKLVETHPRFFSNDNKFTAKSPIYIENDWAKGGRDISSVLACSDIGINLSKRSFESWQSHRVRFIDYLANGLPVLNTYGDYGSQINQDACIRVEAGSIDDYLNVFEKLSKQPSVLSDLKQGAKFAREKYMAENFIPALLQKIEKTPVRRPRTESQESWFMEELVEGEIKSIARSQLV